MAQIGPFFGGEAWLRIAWILDELRHELFTELDVAFGDRRLEGIEAGRFPTAERDVFAAHRSDADLRAAVFVEHDPAERGVLHGLGQEKQFQRGLAGSRRAADKGIAGILLIPRIPIRRGRMEIEVVGLATGGLKEREGFSPGIACGFPTREVVKGTETDEVTTGQGGLPRTQPPIAGKLCKPGTFRNDIHHRHLEAGSVLKGRPRHGARLRHLLQRRPKERHRIE
jgi:hypothetical protein